LYLASMAWRTSGNDLPLARIVITSRVMPRQVVQVAAWLVKVSEPSPWTVLM